MAELNRDLKSRKHYAACFFYAIKSRNGNRKEGNGVNDINHQSMVKEAVRDAFGGSQTVQAKVNQRYPRSAEREFQRVSRAYMKLLNDSLKKHMPEIMEACKESRTDSRYDGFSFDWKLRRIMQKISDEVEQAEAKFGLDDYVQKVADIASAQSIREWKRVVKKTLGINILEDYYKGEAYAESLKKWVAENISQIKSIPSETLGNLEQTILNGYRSGATIGQMKKEIQSEYDVSKRKAELLARDQVATLNAQVTKMQQTDAGVKKYKWSTSKDSRVRDCHAELDGQTFSWDDPPEMWYDTKDGRVYTGRHCNPGEDYLCRCVAIPVFDWQTVDVPMDGGK